MITPRHLAHGALPLLLLFGFNTAAHAAKPAIIWASDPVRSGETVVVRGDGFGGQPKVEISGMESGKWTAAPVAQSTDRTLKFQLPDQWQSGIFRFRVTTPDGTSEETVVNAPKAWWTQGDQSNAATPGGWLRVFGLNLDMGTEPKIKLSNGKTATALVPVPVDDYNFRVDLPASLAVGNYEIEFVSGKGSAAGTVKLGSISVIPQPADPGKVFNVTDYGAVPGQPDCIQYYTGMKSAEQVDSTDAIQATLDAAGKAGGGVVYFPRGIYVLSRGVNLPANVTVRGAGRALTALSWIDEAEPRQKEELANVPWGSLLYKTVKEPGNPAHPYLLKGPGHFNVEDLTIYAVNHRAGIQTDPVDTRPDAGHVKIRRVVLRLNRYLNVQENKRHYTNGHDTFLKRQKEEPTSGKTWQGAIHLSGPNIEITDCDIFSSMSPIVLNGASGLIARNRIAAIPKHWTILARKSQRLIFEENECLNGGVTLLNVHNIASNDSKDLVPSNFARELYCGRNSIKDTYVEDRDGGFVSDFHAPLGAYVGWTKSSNGAKTVLSTPAEGGDVSQSWAGAMVSVLDGKGAGQVRFMKSLNGTELEVDEPWTVPLDETSFITVSKALYRGIFVNNVVADAGNAVSLWAGGVEMIVAGNRSERGGAFNQITLSMAGQFIPCLRAQFLDNVITEGVTWGSAYLFPRGSLIGTYTYTPLSFERAHQAKKGKPVTVPDYNGPMSIDQIFRRNRIENNGCFYAGGMVSNILFENGSVAHSRVGVDIRETGGRWDDDVFDGLGPSDVLIRRIKTEDVSTPYSGDYLKNAKIIQ